MVVDDEGVGLVSSFACVGPGQLRGAIWARFDDVNVGALKRALARKSFIAWLVPSFR